MGKGWRCGEWREVWGRDGGVGNGGRCGEGMEVWESALEDHWSLAGLCAWMMDTLMYHASCDHILYVSGCPDYHPGGMSKHF